jgi:hypothetical protein
VSGDIGGDGGDWLLGWLVGWLVMVGGKDCMLGMYARMCVYMLACVRARGDGGGESICHVIRNNNGAVTAAVRSSMQQEHEQQQQQLE